MEFSEEFMRDYLLGKVEADQVDEFERATAGDPTLKAALEETRDLMIGIKLAEDDALKGKLRQIDATQDKEAKVVTLSSRTRWLWASAAAVLIAATSIYLFLNSGNQNQALYQAYFTDYPNIISPGQRDERNQSAAFMAYQNGQWIQAIEAFDEISTQQADAAYPDFYGALAAMQLQSYSNAIPRLESVIERADPRFTDAATWYLALAYLATDDKAQSRKLLTGLASGDSNFRGEAERLVGEMR